MGEANRREKSCIGNMHSNMSPGTHFRPHQINKIVVVHYGHRSVNKHFNWSAKRRNDISSWAKFHFHSFGFYELCCCFFCFSTYIFPIFFPLFVAIPLALCAGLHLGPFRFIARFGGECVLCCLHSWCLFLWAKGIGNKSAGIFSVSALNIRFVVLFIWFLGTWHSAHRSQQVSRASLRYCVCFHRLFKFYDLSKCPSRLYPFFRCLCIGYHHISVFRWRQSIILATAIIPHHITHFGMSEEGTATTEKNL